MAHVRFVLSIEYKESGGIIRMENHLEKKSKKNPKKYQNGLVFVTLLFANELRVLSIHQFATNT